MWSDLFGDGDRQSTRTAAQVQDFHARPKIQTLDNGVRTVIPEKRIIELDEPSQPGRTGQGFPTRSQTPCGENDE